MFILFHLPVVAVSVDVGLGRRVIGDELEKLVAVDEATDLDFLISGDHIGSKFLRVVVPNENGRFLRIGGQSLLEPVDLCLSKLTLDLVNKSERIEQNPVCQRGFDNRAMLAGDA